MYKAPKVSGEACASYGPPEGLLTGRSDQSLLKRCALIDPLLSVMRTMY
jgi:hypothetical protein